MYIVKAFYTNGASCAQHDEIVIAWTRFYKTVMNGMRDGNLVRAELWDTKAGSDSKFFLAWVIRAKNCPLAVFDVALVEERFAPSFRELELIRNASV